MKPSEIIWRKHIELLDRNENMTVEQAMIEAIISFLDEKECGSK